MMGAPGGVDLYADIHARELRRRTAHERAFAWLGAVLVALVLTCDWWAR